MNSLSLRTLLIVLFFFLSACDRNEAAEKERGEKKAHVHEKGHKHAAGEQHKHSKNEKSHSDKHPGHQHKAGEKHAHAEKKESGKEHGHSHGAKKDKHGHAHGKEGHEEENVVKLDDKKRKMAGIVTKPAKGDTAAIQFTTTGEVKLDSYASANITPRIQAQVVKRLVKRGDAVKKNQPLVVLSSVKMAEAQAALLLAEQEWRRVRILGKSVVSARRITEAKVKYQLAFAKVQAYGMNKKQVEALLRKKDAKSANGRFVLESTIDGTVIHDDFIEGEVVEPGKVLYKITNESKVWVEAHVKPEQVHRLRIGNPAKIRSKSMVMDAKVIQLPHMVDEKTRTIPVRLSVDNVKDVLHAGEFVSVTFVIRNGDGTQRSHLGTVRIPTGAVVRNSKGKWRVFVEKEPNRFEAVDVKIIKNDGDDVLVKGQVHDKNIVIKGAFFLQSELSKGGFHIHNH